jgi:hypothetical protein
MWLYLHPGWASAASLLCSCSVRACIKLSLPNLSVCQAAAARVTRYYLSTGFALSVGLSIRSPKPLHPKTHLHCRHSCEGLQAFSNALLHLERQPAIPGELHTRGCSAVRSQAYKAGQAAAAAAATCEYRNQAGELFNCDRQLTTEGGSQLFNQEALTTASLRGACCST